MAEILANVHVEPLAAMSDDLPGLVAQGRTVAETLEITPGRHAITGTPHRRSEARDRSDTP